jgi:Domain of unknown function (DUF3846)
MKVVVKEVNKPMEVKEIENTLEDAQALVGGYIEIVRLPEGILLVLNEEGKLQGLEANFKLGNDMIVGDVFFTKSDEEGDFVTLSDMEIALVKSWFYEAE